MMTDREAEYVRLKRCPKGRLGLPSSDMALLSAPWSMRCSAVAVAVCDRCGGSGSGGGPCTNQVFGAPHMLPVHLRAAGTHL